MEIVKRLEGSEPEEVDYEFGEYYRQEDEKQNKRKKNTLVTIFGIILISILGYVGFNYLENKKTKQIMEPKIIEKSQTIVKEEKVLPKVIEKKLPPETPVVSTYTEVLAQAIEPEPIKTQEVKAKNLEEDYVKKIEAEALNLKAVKVELPKEKSKNIKSTDSVIMKQDKSHNRITFYSEEPTKKTVTIQQPVIQKPKVKKIKPKVAKRKVVTKKSKPKILKNKRRVITVKKGDTLAIIAKRYYGDSLEFKGIVRANKRLKTSSTPLKLGEKLVIPSLKKSKTKRVISKKSVTAKKKVTHKKKVKAKKRRYVTVKKGYSLAYISKKFYGNVNEIQRIVKANKDIKSAKSTLHIGQKVYIPR